MKVLLIQPPFTIFKAESRKCNPPLGLAYLAAVLKSRHEIVALDALTLGHNNLEKVGRNYIRYGLSFRDIKREIERIHPDIVGVSCLFSSQSENVFNVCRVVKEVDDRIVTVVGGAHPSSDPEEVLLESSIDFAVIGEGELVFPQLLESLEKQKDYSLIDGLVFRNERTIIVNRRKELESNLDKIPFPLWEIFPLEKYFKINNPHGGHVRNTPFLPVITSRGCPFNCIFCSIHNIWGSVYRVRSPENVLSEFIYIKNKFGIREVMIEDDNFSLDKIRTKVILRGMISMGLRLSWSTPNGVAIQTLDKEVLRLMKESGCYSLSFGIESGDEYMLKKVIKKPLELPMVRPIINEAKDLGIETTVFFVVGLPYEDKISLQKTFRFAKELKADNTNYFFATPLPGTRLYDFCKSKGLLSKNLDYLNLKSDFPFFQIGVLPKKQLIYLVHKEKIKLYFIFLLTNPARFFLKFKSKLIKDKAYFFRNFCKLFSLP